MQELELPLNTTVCKKYLVVRESAIFGAKCYLDKTLNWVSFESEAEMQLMEIDIAKAMVEMLEKKNDVEYGMTYKWFWYYTKEITCSKD